MHKTTKVEFIEGIHEMDRLMGRERRTGLTKLLYNELRQLHSDVTDDLLCHTDETSTVLDKAAPGYEGTPFDPNHPVNKIRGSKRVKVRKTRRPRRKRLVQTDPNRPGLGSNLPWSMAEGSSRAQRRVGTKNAIRNARKGVKR